MDPEIENTFLNFDSPQEQPCCIKVIGVGGGGNNAVNHMYREGIKGVEFINCNTDRKALDNSPVMTKILLGKGLGAGNRPEVARKYAQEKADEIREVIGENTQMLFITAGMGGGTGTGAAPVVAEIAKSIELDNDTNKHILVVAIVTMPFTVEGRLRRAQAEAGIEALRDHCDSVLIINNDKLRSEFGNFALSSAFGKANDVLLTAAKGIAEVITVSDYVNIDFQDVNTVMEKSGTALMGTGVGTGENRAAEAIVAASTSVLLNDNEISGAKNVLLYFSYSPEHEITMDELGYITDYIYNLTGDANVIWGAGSDDNMGEELQVTLIATGFEQKSTQGPSRKVLEEDEKPTKVEAPVVKDSVPEPIAQPIVPEDIYVKHTEPEVEAPKAPVVDTTEAENKMASQSAELNRPGQVFVLEDEPEMEMAEVEEPVAQPQAVAAVDEVRLVHTAPAPIVEAPKPFVAEPQPIVEAVKTPEVVAEVVQQPSERPTPQPVAPQRSMPNQDTSMRERSERLRRMNELLHSNPEQFERLSISELTSEPIFMGQSATASDAALTIDDGTSMGPNPYIFGNNPD